MKFKPGMRVLDLGCGRALSSIFLAKEFDLEVWAADLWTNPTDNWKRIQEAHLEKRVFPLHTEAHALPFPEEFFDAIVSVDAFHYFGTDDLYLKYIIKYLVKGGQMGIVCPGLKHEFGDHLPKHLLPYWDADFYSFHSPEWWSHHWKKSGTVDIVCSEMIPDAWKFWKLWMEIIAEEKERESSKKEAEMVGVDAGQHLGFVKIVSAKTL